MAVRSVLVTAACALFLASAARGATIEPTAADRAAFSAGMAMQQAINVFQNPRTCAIVLLRGGCKNAFMALASLAPSGPAEQSLTSSAFTRFASQGDIDLFDQKWSDANAVVIPEIAWKRDALATWLKTAGVILESSYNPQGELLHLMEMPMYAGLALHASAAGPYGSLIPSAIQRRARLSLNSSKVGPLKTNTLGITLTDGDVLAARLLPVLKGLFPAESQPVVSVGQGLRGDMQIGVFVSTANEMFESPLLFLEPQSRAFFHDACVALATIQTSAAKASRARILGQKFLSLDSPTAWKAAFGDWQTLAESTGRDLPKPRKDAFIFGLMAAQAAYNAAFLREKPALADQLGFLGEERSLATQVPAIGPPLSALLDADKTNWHLVNLMASALTASIFGP
jgi:hypothetical protein